ncbi:MAG: Mpo1-like protein [Burkholderiales bacterium]
MKSVDEQMSVYAVYHRNRWNKATHFIGVPAIIFAILVPMSWIQFGDNVTLARVFVVAALIYYFALDAAFALTTAVMVGALLYAAEHAAAGGATAGWIWFGIFFVGGWAFQLVGHVFEGRKPALADNLFQIFVAPIFLVAEIFFALGLKRDMREKIEARLRAASPQ